MDTSKMTDFVFSTGLPMVPTKDSFEFAKDNKVNPWGCQKATVFSKDGFDMDI